jgi:hypothetical protein
VYGIVFESRHFNENHYKQMVSIVQGAFGNESKTMTPQRSVLWGNREIPFWACASKAFLLNILSVLGQ